MICLSLESFLQGNNDHEGRGPAMTRRAWMPNCLYSTFTLFITKRILDILDTLVSSWRNFKSTVKHISSYEADGIAVKDLPETVQDAIFCTRQIGLRYLWVDALCIIQDDQSDKRRQIPRIHETFHFATVTIVASRSETVYDGFLGKPRTSDRRSGRLPYYSPGSSGIGAFHLVQTHVQEYSYGSANTRAWTLEEALQSPRLLIYSACGLR